MNEIGWNVSKLGSETNQQKKFRKFSAKELRTQLHGNKKLIALQDFLQQIKENSCQDCGMEYLQENGNMQELVQCMESDVNMPPVLILEIVNELLLKTTLSTLDCQKATYDTCRYLLNNFSTSLNKMLGLTSTSEERIITLKLLTTMAAFSSLLAKDILKNIKFHTTNLELITKITFKNISVRKQFIYFLIAVLINAEYSTLYVLLEKKEILASIIPGLQFDEVDVVCIILTAMKNNILENQYVSKTLKMKTFNTIVVKNIVNLYNWKGLKYCKLSKKNDDALFQVDEFQKAKVSECVHDFLMVLCTSHKFGITFRDPLVGMGKKTQNSLIYTILNSMDSAWNHSYASELVIKICAACPDLTKYVWHNLKSPLELRYSMKWLKAIDFVKRLLEELQPSCLEPYVKQMNVYQISQLIIMLVAPLPILKILIPENKNYELQIIRYYAMSSLLAMVQSIRRFIEDAQNWLNEKLLSKLKANLANYLERNFPTGYILLNNWSGQDATEEPEGFNQRKYLSLVFDIFENYMTLCPELLESINFSNNDLKILLQTVDSLSVNLVEQEVDELKVKIMDLFLHVYPSIFTIDSESYEYFLTFILRVNHKNAKNDNFRHDSVAEKLLRNTRIFDFGLEDEIEIWTNGIFALNIFCHKVPAFLVGALRLTNLKMVEYMKLMSNIQSLKSVNLSPMLLGALEYLGSIEADESLISYCNYVIPNLMFLESYNGAIFPILRKSNAIKSPLLNYVNSVVCEDFSFEIPTLLSVFGEQDIYSKWNSALAHDNFEYFLKVNKGNIFLFSSLKMHLLRMGIFYFIKLLRLDHTYQNIYGKNLIIFIDFILEHTYFRADIILNNQILAEHFSILDMKENGAFNCCTNFVVDFIKHYCEKHVLTENDFKIYHKKINNFLFKILKNPEKYTDLPVSEIMEIFKINSETHFAVISKISNYISKEHEAHKHEFLMSILVLSLEKYSELKKSEQHALSADICKNLFKFLCLLNETNGINTSKLSKALLGYLLVFPENVNQVDKNLVNSILNLKKYDKSSTDLLIFLLTKRTDFISCIGENMDKLLALKGNFYPVLHLLGQILNANEHNAKFEMVELFQRIFCKFENTLHKALKKPHKASPHLDKNYQGVSLLIELNFQKEIFREYVSKILKFEVAKIFHVHLLYTIFKEYVKKEVDSKIVNNTILTFVYLLIYVLKKIPKNEEDTIEIVNNICDCFMNYLGDIERCSQKFDFETLRKHESFRLMSRLCLKYGVSSHVKLLTILVKLINLVGQTLNAEEMKLSTKMLFSHSDFLDVVLSEKHKCKKWILSLMLAVCERCPQVMERSHIPIILSSYGASLNKSDIITLKLLKMYESAKHQTSFCDFKPYVWGSAAASYYSLRSDIGKNLLRQPRVGDVLNILQENTVLSTVKNYHLYHSAERPDNLKAGSIYDLEFFLPMFSHLLTPENVVHTYKFTRNGALSLTIIAFSSKDQRLRAAAYHVLERFYFHLEAKQTGKDNLLWIRFVEAICKGIFASGSKKEINNFATMFLARTALILTQPNNVMYLPLSLYLAAKPSLDFTSVPELYTFLHSSDIYFKEQRAFIFEILMDGLIFESDFIVFFHSMALKLCLEMYASCTCDPELKHSILDILISVCRLSIGIKFVCTHNAVIEYLTMELEKHLRGSTDKSTTTTLSKLAHIFTRISSTLEESSVWEKYLSLHSCQIISKYEIKIVSSDLSSAFLESKP